MSASQIVIAKRVGKTYATQGWGINFPSFKVYMRQILGKDASSFSPEQMCLAYHTAQSISRKGS